MSMKVRKLLSVFIALLFCFTSFPFQVNEAHAASSMAQIILNDTSLGLSADKKRTMATVTDAMLNAGFEPAFIAGALGNIALEGSFGLFEGSNKVETDPARYYLEYMNTHYQYHEKFSYKYIYNCNFAEVCAIDNELYNLGYPGKFGLGCCQWTGGRTHCLLKNYKKIAGDSDTITYEQVMIGECLTMIEELSGGCPDHNKKSVYTNWLSQYSGNLSSATAAEMAGRVFCTKYELPADYKNKQYERGEMAAKIYNLWTNNLSNIWYETLTPVNLGNSFDALILNKAAWIPVRTLSSTNVVTHPEEWVTNELWRFTRQSDGSYQILNWKNGLCLDADNFGTTDGTNIGSVASNNSTAQKWFIYSVNGGYVLRPSYGELAMDSWGDSTSNGNNVHLWSYQGHDGQVMSIYKDEAAPLGKPAPSAPTVTAVSDTSLSITWSSTIYTDKYIVYRSTDNSSWTKLGEVTNPGYTDTWLKANTKYYYKYESTNRFYTVASASASGTTKPVPTYIVKYNSNKGTGSMSDSTFTRDQSVTLRANAFTRTGYTFKSWNTKSDGSGTSYSDKANVKNLATAGGSITLYANWEANPITIAYNANGGTGTMSNQSMKYDQTANLTANAFTRTGYTFAGWNTKADGSGTSYADKASVKNLAASGTITLYARWTANKYTVKFDGNGADELGKTSMEVTYNSTYGELPHPKRDGYNFIGWYTKAEGGNAITPDAKVTITETQTLYAQWSQVKFLITFNATGGTSESAQKLVTYDKAYGVLPTAERTGYTFKGWYLDEKYTQQITSDTIVALTANQFVYAKWELVKYVITFDATGGTSERDSKQVTYGKTYGVLPSATKDGDEFIGWFTEDGTEITSASIVEIESDTTLYAKWASDEVIGDVNADGVFNVADVVMMQKWLLCAGGLTDWQAGDLCRDERIDVFDLCLMKRLLIEKEGN